MALGPRSWAQNTSKQLEIVSHGEILRCFSPKVVQKYGIETAGKLDGFGADSAGLAEKEGCFTVPRNSTQEDFAAKHWGGVGVCSGVFGSFSALNRSRMRSLISLSCARRS